MCTDFSWHDIWKIRIKLGRLQKLRRLKCRETDEDYQEWRLRLSSRPRLKVKPTLRCRSVWYLDHNSGQIETQTKTMPIGIQTMNLNVENQDGSKTALNWNADITATYLWHHVNCLLVLSMSFCWNVVCGMTLSAEWQSTERIGIKMAKLGSVPN